MALNLVLAALSAVLIAYIVRQLVTPTPLPVGGRRAAATTVVPAPVERPRPPAGAYGVVASRNLFNPARSESASGTTTAAVTPLVRPNLFGIVVRDGGSIAYLEDPVTKRVVGYRVGDKVVGGTVQTIKADSVVIERPEGPVDVRLRDPGKPRTAATPPPGGAPQLGAAPGTFPQPQQGAVLPGVIPPAASATPLPQQPQPLPPQAIQPQVPQLAQPGIGAPGTPVPTLPPAGARRPLPPNLLRRLPPAQSNGTQQ